MAILDIARPRYFQTRDIADFEASKSQFWGQEEKEKKSNIRGKT